MMSARVALVPRPRSSISSISLACEIRDGGWVSLPTIHGLASGASSARNSGTAASRSSWPSCSAGISSSAERA